jgi:hypothetical protein
LVFNHFLPDFSTSSWWHQHLLGTVTETPKGRHDLGQVFVPIEDSVKAKDCDVGTPDGVMG